MFEHVPKHQQPIGYQNVNLIDLTHVRGGGETYPPSHYVVYLDDDEIRRHFEGILHGDVPMLTNTEDLEVSKAVREVRYGCMLLLLNYFFRLTVLGTEVKDGMTMGHGRDVLSCIENTLDDLEVEMDENTQGIVYEMTSAMLKDGYENWEFNDEAYYDFLQQDDVNDFFNAFMRRYIIGIEGLGIINVYRDHGEHEWVGMNCIQDFSYRNGFLRFTIS